MDFLNSTPETTNCNQEEYDAFMAIDSFGNADSLLLFPNSDALIFSSVVKEVHPLVDSGASRTVAGTSWTRGWVGLSGSAPLPPLNSSTRWFKFGSQDRFQSLGTFVFRGFIPDAKDAEKADSPEILPIEADIIDLPVPFLLSQATLRDLCASIHFQPHQMILRNSLTIPLETTGI